LRENRVKTALLAGKTVVGAGLTIAANPLVVRVLAEAGYDWLFIDVEHTAIAPDMLAAVVQMARLAGISPIVRVQDSEYHLIANVLDMGADGIIVPRVETAEQAARVVSYARFPPEGVRGCGTTATLDYQRPEWTQALPWLNRQTLVAIQVESARAVANLEAILQVPGMDAVFVGPLDLSISLGLPGQFGHPKVIAAIEQIVDTCVAAGKPVGTVLGTPEALRPWWQRGMRFLTCSGDANMLLDTGSRHVAGVRAYAGAL
jgi:2-dehydro-3-deoxyglucarate aldolase/4-hydroxy-2-oxoheptanedioate aldolase